MRGVGVGTARVEGGSGDDLHRHRTRSVRDASGIVDFVRRDTDGETRDDVRRGRDSRSTSSAVDDATRPDPIDRWIGSFARSSALTRMDGRISFVVSVGFWRVVNRQILLKSLD